MPGEDAISKGLRKLINKGKLPASLAIAVFMKAEQAGAVRSSLSLTPTSRSAPQVS